MKADTRRAVAHAVLALFIPLPASFIWCQSLIFTVPHESLSDFGTQGFDQALVRARVTDRGATLLRGFWWPRGADFIFFVHDLGRAIRRDLDDAERGRRVAAEQFHAAVRARGEIFDLHV